MISLSKFRARHIVKKTATAASALVALTAISLTGAQAAPITIPTGLNPGDTYRLAFVTSTARNATSSNIADYNTFVTGVANTQAALAALATTWTAIASTASVDARDNTNTLQTSAGGSNGSPIFLLNDTQLASGNDSLWDGTIDFDFDIRENGFQIGTINVWTGTDPDGTAVASFLLGAPDVTFGKTYATTDEWVEAGIRSPFVEARFYAISGTLTVAGTQIPEPGPLSLLALGLVGLGFARRKRVA